ncbi:MAG TPA: hypothetical protein VFY29_01945 [Terriglobia bacterium]|nr:hypothetical protein [Terriglobia bacterium]
MTGTFMKTSVLALSLTFAAATAQAQSPRLWPVFSAAGGAYALSTDNVARLDGASEIAGTNVDWERDLGLPGATWAPSMNVSWQPFRRHSISVDYVRYKQSQSGAIARDLVIGGIAFPAGVNVDARFNIGEVDVAYTCWLARREKFGIGASLGVVVLDLDAEVSAAVEIGAQRFEARRYSARADAPVPMIGAAARGNPWGRFVWRADGRLLPTVSIGNSRGHAATYNASAEFFVLNHGAVGVAYTGKATKADFDLSDWRGRVDLRSRGWRTFFRIAL